MDKRVLMAAAALVIIIGGGAFALAYLGVSQKTVYIDKAQIEAPAAALAPTTAGILRAVYVHEGDLIAPNTVVAQVGVELIKSTPGGLVIMARTDLGSRVNAGEAVAQTIDPGALRVVGQLPEDKGLAEVKVGQPATFTVDAFGGQKFTGTVMEVSPTAGAGDVVFSISDKRQIQNFDIKVSFDTAAYPQLKNGMSAKIWVYKTQ